MCLQGKSGERGFTLIETILAAAVVLVVVMGLLTAMTVQVGSVEMEARANRAHDACDSALELLTARIHTMGVAAGGGGTFTAEADNRVALTGACSLTWCDKYLVDADGRQVGEAGGSFAGGTAWTAAEQEGAAREFVRRWRIDLVTGRPNLRVITVAVFDNETSAAPIVMQRTRVAIRNP